jgi:Mrp family chromosome partitioning ATPase
MQLASTLPVRCERQLVATLGPALLGARPVRPEALHALAEQIIEHWSGRGRTLVPVIGLHAGEGRSSLALDLAGRLAGLGARTLLVDADLRRPSLHARLGVANERGLADLLDGRKVQLVPVRENLALLPAGRSREYALELLSRPALLTFMHAAARPFQAVVIDTPAAERGPDFEMFAALARGALVIVRPGERARELALFGKRLARCAAPPIAALFRN